MVEFSVFNELSLPIPHERLFGDFFKVLEELKKVGLAKIRMDRDFTLYPEILPHTSSQQFFGRLHDRDKKTRLRSFISNGISIIESPLINDDEIDSLGERIEPHYIFEGQPTLGGLACADIWGTIAISFQSDEKWKNALIELHKDGTPINISHISDSTHIALHKDFFDKLEQCIQLDIKPTNFWNQREELFTRKIVLCKEVEKQIKQIDTLIFVQALSILRNIECGHKSLSDFTISGEGETVRNNPELKKLREFTIDGQKEFFQKHIKNLSDGYRIYYLEKNDKIYIGYIGKHLPTKKF